MKQKGKIKRRIFAYLALALVFVSCNMDKNLFRLDIANSVSLFISPVDSILKSSILFKITEEGIVKEVSYLNKRGKQIKKTFFPIMIYTINNSDFFVASIKKQQFKTNTYLVRKSDGVVFNMNVSIELSDNNRVGGYSNSDYFAQDDNKNMYFMSHKQIFRLNISNLNNITGIPLTTNSQMLLWGFTLSSKGDIFFNTNGVYKVRIAEKLRNVPYIKLSTNSWTGLDGRIKYIVDGMNYFKYDIKTNDYTFFYPVNVYAVDIDENNVAYFTVEKTIDTIGGWYHSASLMLRFNNRVILIPVNFYGASNFLEVENPSNTIREIILPYGISSINRAVNSDNYYYLSGRNSLQQPFLIKVDAATDCVTELLPANAYEVYTMVVSNNDYLIFNALRKSDGVKILGEISPNGELKIIDEQMNVEVTVLKHIQN